MRRLLILVPLLLLGATGPARAEDSLRRWLADADPVLRALAAFELRRHAETGTVALAAEALATERDPIVRACLLGSLAGRPRVDLVAEGGGVLPGLLLRLLGDDAPVLRERSLAVLRGFLPASEAPPGDAAGWRVWWLGARAGLEREQRTLLAARAEAERAAAATPEAGEGGTTPKPEDLLDHVERLRQDGLDLVIVMDHTGSMATVIGQARARAASLVRRLAWLVPRFRAGLVTYDDGARLRIELTNDGEALAKAFRKVGAGGGADYEEGVDKGVGMALRQEMLGWSRKAWRVVVVVGDAPPHGYDVGGLLRTIARARDDVLYDHPVVVHTVSTTPMGVPHFDAIARVGGGTHVTLADAGRLETELVALAFGPAWRDRVVPWVEEMERLQEDLR